MYCKFFHAFVLCSFVIPALSLAVPQQARLERRDLAAGSVETLEAREPFKQVPRRNVNVNAVQDAVRRIRAMTLGIRVRAAAARISQAFSRGRFSRPRKRDLSDTEDLEARDLAEFDELDARSFVDGDDELVLRSLFDEIDELDARSLFDDLEDLEAREFMGETGLDELD